MSSVTVCVVDMDTPISRTLIPKHLGEVKPSLVRGKETGKPFCGLSANFDNEFRNVHCSCQNPKRIHVIHRAC